MINWRDREVKDMLQRIVDNVGKKGLISAQAFTEAATALVGHGDCP